MIQVNISAESVHHEAVELVLQLTFTRKKES